MKLLDNRKLIYALSKNGKMSADGFSWKKSDSLLESILFG
jgi:hypothetical protein